MLSHAGAAPNAVNVTDEDGDTPLFTVEDVEVAKVLVELGADAKLKNQAGETVSRPCDAGEEEEREN